jgi:hypothetical protein
MAKNVGLVVCGAVLSLSLSISLFHPFTFPFSGGGAYLANPLSSPIRMTLTE